MKKKKDKAKKKAKKKRRKKEIEIVSGLFNFKGNPAPSAGLPFFFGKLSGNYKIYFSNAVLTLACPGRHCFGIKKNPRLTNKSVSDNRILIISAQCKFPDVGLKPSPV